MWRVARTTLAACALAITLPIAQAQEQAMTQALDPAESGHVEINGVDYHYQIHGEGEPLLLLHGGLGTFDMFAPILPSLTATRKVIGIDLHGHGRTPLGDRAIDLVEMGGDLARVIEALGHEQVDVMGYSMGGGVGAQIAVQNPDLVRRLVLVSTPAAKDGFYPAIVDQMHQIGAHVAEAMYGTPMHQAYAAVAPVVDDFPRLLQALGDMVRRPDIYQLEVERLTMPVMLVYGDGDMFRLEHVIEFYQRLGGGQGDAGWMRENMGQNRLAILADLTHYEIFLAPEMVRTVLPFLNGTSSPPVWTAEEQAAE